MVSAIDDRPQNPIKIKPPFAKTMIIAAMVSWICLLVVMLGISNLRQDVIHAILVLSVGLTVVYLVLAFDWKCRRFDRSPENDELNSVFGTTWTIAYAAAIVLKASIKFPLDDVVMLVGLIHLLIKRIQLRRRLSANR